MKNKRDFLSEVMYVMALVGGWLYAIRLLTEILEYFLN